MSTYNLGRILPEFRGTWEAAYNYFPLDVVLYQGSSYVAKSTITAGTGNPTTNTNNWQMIAAAGEISGTLTPEQQQAIINAVIQQGGFVSDSNYVHTDNNFSDTYKEAVDNIGNGTLTLSVNSTQVGTFTANQSTNANVNITVPTSLNDLQNTGDLVHAKNYARLSSSNATIDVLKTNTIYDASVPLDSLKILAFEVDESDKSTWTSPESYIYFTTGTNFNLFVTPSHYFADSTPVFRDNTIYMIRVTGAVLEVKELI